MSNGCPNGRIFRAGAIDYPHSSDHLIYSIDGEGIPVLYRGGTDPLQKFYYPKNYVDFKKKMTDNGSCDAE
jgi:hypothetical protein